MSIKHRVYPLTKLTSLETKSCSHLCNLLSFKLIRKPLLKVSNILQKLDIILKTSPCKREYESV